MMGSSAEYHFDRFTIRPQQRQLLVDGQLATVGGRAFDILVALIDRRDRVVSKDELLDLVWPGTVVEEANLPVHIGALRKLIGPSAIATIPGRGYQFVAATDAPDPTDAPASAPTATAIAARTSGLSLVRARLVGALALAFLAACWLGWRTWSPPPRPVASIAAVGDKPATAPGLSVVVLPFDNLSGDSEQEFFADGITDDLTTDLSHLPDSFVIARNTAFTYKGKAVDVKQLGRDLGVRYVLEGSVRRVGETITLNAQLISTETGAQIWADRFEGERSRLGQLQVEFVARLARSLDVELVRAESLRAMRERPNNPDAVDFSMRGSAAYNEGLTPENLKRAIGNFEQALRLDPQLPQALIGRSLARINLLWATQSSDFEPVLKSVEESMDHVLAAQPDNAWAHFIKAEVAEARKQSDDAVAQLSAAIASDANFAPAYGELALAMIYLGRASKAFEPGNKALRLSPRDPLRFFWQYYICHAYAHLAQWEQAIEWCAISKTTNPSLWYSYVDLASAYAWLGRETDAKGAMSELQKLNHGLTLQKWLNYPFSDNPQFKRELERIGEGLRKAGLPEQ